MTPLSGGWNKDKTEQFKVLFHDFLQHVQIASKEWEGFKTLPLYTAQRRFLTEVFDGLEKDIRSFTVLKARQLGLSTIVRCLIVFWAYVNEGMKIALVYDTDSNRRDARAEIQQFLERLPETHTIALKQGGDNRDFMEFENGSRISFFVAGIKKSRGSGGLGRSRGIAAAGCTEISSWVDIEGLKSFERSLSHTHPNRLYIWESTARGFNIFHTLWEAAKADTLTKRAIFIGWWAKESYSYPRGSLLFERYGSAAPDENEKAKIKEVQERYGFAVTMEQLAWYRHQTEPKMDGSFREVEASTGAEINLQELPWCVVAGTRVGTDHGIIPIEEALPGYVGSLGAITSAGQTGVAQTYEMTTALGYRFVGTGNHPVAKTDGSFVDLKDCADQRVRLQPPRFAAKEYVFRWNEGSIECAVPITPDMARLVGFYMGDGSLQGAGKKGGAGVLSIACDRKDQDVVNEVRRLVETIFGVEVPTRIKGGCEEVRSGSRLVVETFRKMGLARNDTVKTMRNVHVPEFIWRSPKHVVREFLRGLFEADGFNGYGGERVVLFSKWPKFLEDVQILLLGFGVTCRRTSRLARTTYVEKGVSRKHSYTANELQLRSEEGIAFNKQIGFVGARKIARSSTRLTGRKRYSSRRVPLALEDTVARVEQRDIAPVYNVSVAEHHMFDANGVLTHNTEDEAFLMTGSKFFPSDRLTLATKAALTYPMTGYRYHLGDDFTATIIEPARSARHAHLRIWEDPDPSGVYAIGADPAYGSGPTSDRHVAQILRCYSDGVDQVGEFCDPNITTYQFAWVLAHLAGAYAGEGGTGVRLLLELNGPGEAVLNAIRELEFAARMNQFDHDNGERGVKNIFTNVRHFLNVSGDKLNRTPTTVHWKTTPKNKIHILERERDFFHVGQLNIRSIDLLEEMRTVVRRGDSIGGEGTAKDDRVMAMALAVRAWEEGERKRLIVQERSRENEAKRRTLTADDYQAMFSGSVVKDFFQRQRRERVESARSARRGNRWNW